MILVELFRNRGELAPALLRICANLELDHDGVAQASIDLSQVVSTEYRADAVIELSGGEGQKVGAVIVEVQLRDDADKPWTWPVYVAALRAKLRCAVFLLVLAPEHRVADKVRASIALGHPGFQLTPLVIEFADLPRIVDPDDARQLPELAVLAAMAHPEVDVAVAAIEANEPLPEDQKQLYLDVILARLPALVRTALEAHMRGYEYQSEFARTYYNQGRSEGRSEGREEGLCSAVVKLAHARGDAISAEEQAAIGALRGEAVLTELIGALAQARNPAEARAVLDQVVRGSRATDEE